MRFNLIFIAVFILNYANSFTQIKSIRLGNLSIEQGLSQSTVQCIAQDSSGFLWLGTQDGLNKYNGYNFEVYTPVPDDFSSISDNYIICLYVDKSGQMWIGTDNGLNKYISATDSFIAFKHNPDDPKSISSNIVSDIAEDHQGNMWIGTKNGLNFFDKRKNEFIRYFHDSKNKSSLLSNLIYATFVDSKNRLWIGTDLGMDLFDSKTKSFKHFTHLSNGKNSAVEQKINSLAEDQEGNLWIGTFNGLDKYNFQSNSFTHFIHSAFKKGSISSDSIRVVYVDKKGIVWIGTQNNGLNYYNSASGDFAVLEDSVANSTATNDRQIRALMEDREGLLWIGSFSSGIYKYDRMKKLFGLIRIDDKNGNNLEENDISAICKDQNDNLWIGSFYAGINKLNERTGKIVRYTHTSSLNSLINNFINVIFADKKGFVWIGTTAGLDKLNSDANTFVHFKHKKNDINSLGNDYVSSITCDNSGNLWIGLIDGGMDQFNPAANQFTHYKHADNEPNTISSNGVNYLFFDNDGILWIGTNGYGLDRFDPKTKKFQHFVHEINNQNSLCNNVVLSIYQFPADTTGTIWIASAGGGISRLDTRTEYFKNYSEKDGLANNEAYSILGDEMGDLWISTNNGISKFNTTKQTFHNYNQSDGLQSNEFNQGSFFKSKAGKMYFGGKSGINAFFPDSIKYNSYNPQVVFTSFKDYNRPIRLKNSIWETKQIRLSYQDNILSFSFAALSYNDPENNNFAYMLKGLNNKWIDKGSNNEVTFTNLPPGYFTLLIKGTNKDGIWSRNMASIDIIISPPFWQTWWFRSIILAGLVTVIIFSVELRLKTVRSRNKKLETVVSIRTKELKSKKEELEKVNLNQAELLEKLTKSEIELKELNRHKDKIMSVLAHDLRSPFNGLLGYADLLANEIDQMEREDIIQSAQRINIAANSLFRLLNNLLDWTLVQSGRIKYSPSNENLLQSVNEVTRLLKVNADQKSISLKIYIENCLNVWADRNMLDIILRNLVSNAIKFTPVGGEINICSPVRGLNYISDNHNKSSNDIV